MRPEWNDFVGGKWESEINVRDFIQKNYTPYDGDDSFLADATQDTKDLWEQVLDLAKQEREAAERESARLLQIEKDKQAAIEAELKAKQAAELKVIQENQVYMKARKIL